MLFAKMGVPNGQLAFFTTLLYFPWFLKGLWGPFVDIFRTKRWWILSMQGLLTILCILLTVTLPSPEAEQIAAKTTSVGLFRWSLIFFIIAAFASATHDIAADGYYMLAHDERSQAAFVGIRSTFYRIASVFSQGVLVYIAGYIENKTGNIPLSWQVTLGATSVILLLVTIYHCFALPKVETEEKGERLEAKGVWIELGKAFGTFFTKPGVGLAIAFMLLYRLSEGFLVKLCQPFLLDHAVEELRQGETTFSLFGMDLFSVHHTLHVGGGLALGTDIVGIMYGTLGVIGLLIGGILGGIYISRRGLKRSMAVSFEQFGYGFGFTAYMLYMMYFAEGEYKTAHYAICTAFMALSMMIPGFVAGFIQESVGYSAFFWIANAFSITTFAVTYFVWKRLEN